MPNILNELKGIKVGDKIKYKGNTGYVAVIDPTDNPWPYLLRLDKFIGNDAMGFWDESWYPENEKKDKQNCMWVHKEEFEVIEQTKFVIHCTSEKLEKKVLKKLEKETNLKWKIGQKPTEPSTWPIFREKTALIIDKDIGHCNIEYALQEKKTMYENHKFITAGEFLNNVSILNN